MMSTENDTSSFHILAPQKGTYLLDIFAAQYPNYEMCQRQEATKYINVCRFRLNVNGVDKVNVPLPECAPGEWGPTKAVKLVGLIPTSHLYPVINAAPDTNVNLKEDKPLTLNMEFEMTKPMPDFLYHFLLYKWQIVSVCVLITREVAKIHRSNHIYSESVCLGEGFRPFCFTLASIFSA